METISLQGSYYDIGRALGGKTKTAIHAILQDFQSSPLYTDVLQLLDTPEGEEIYATFRRTTDTHCPNIVQELQGVADGAGVPYKDLFLFNLDAEFVAYFSAVPGHSHDVKYSLYTDGCTNLSLRTGDNQLYLVHTEDITPVQNRYGLMIDVQICGHGGTEPVECFTDYCVPGVLSGSKFGFNKHGLMHAHNNIYQENIHTDGIPRKFMARMLLSARTPEEMRNMLVKSPGIASGYSFQLLQRDMMAGGSHSLSNTVLEVAGTEQGTKLAEFSPRQFYFHTNMYQHLVHPCHPEESSVHRAAILSRYIYTAIPRAREDLLTLISNQDDPVFPIYRTGENPDYLATAATCAFDTVTMTMDVYSEKPNCSKPCASFNVLKYTSTDRE